MLPVRFKKVSISMDQINVKRIENSCHRKVNVC